MTHLMGHCIDFDENIVEDGNQQIDEQNVGNQKVHGHGDWCYPVAC